MKHLLSRLGISVLFFHSLAMADTWPHEKSDLKPDANAILGKLDNGLRYLIYPNKFPVAGRASIRLFVDAGSLMEEDDQQGMAHFLEHMAFNGSKNFAAGTMVERFQRLGMGFGADTNAHTSFKETVYKLELPRVDEKMLTEGLQLFRDDLDGILFGQSEIDKERGVILSEKLSRDSVETRVMEAGYAFALPDSLIPKRMPIGIEETLKTMNRPRFADFYEKWYTPKRAVLIIVGDVDVTLVEKLIRQHFTDAAPRRGDSPDPSFGSVNPRRGLIATLHTEMEAAATDISLEVVLPRAKEPDTANKRRQKMIRNLADSMLNQRLSEIAKAEGSPVMDVQAYNYELFQFAHNHGVYAKCKPENWKAALSLCEQELRRAIVHGFTKGEFAEASASILKQVRLRAEQKATRKNSDLANGFAQLLGDEQVFTDPVDDLKRVEAELATLKVEDCLTAFQESWKAGDVQIFAGGNLKLDNAPQTLIAAYQESTAKEVAAPKQTEDAVFAYTHFGKPGEIVKSEEVADLQIKQSAFANHVRLNVKQTDFEKNSVRVMVTFGGGKLEAPIEKPGLIQFAMGITEEDSEGGSTIFEAGGLEKHSADDLRRIFAGKSVSTQFNVGDDSFVLAGKTTPQDLEAQLQLLCAYVTAPGFREEAERQFKMNLDSLYTQLNHTAEGVMQNEVVGFIHGGDSRFSYPKKEVMASRTSAELKAWMTPALQSGYMEIAVVGDVEPKAVQEAVARTFGALPKRADYRTDYAKEREVTFPSAPREKDFAFTTEIPRAYALAYWPTEDMLNIQRTRRLMLLGDILDDRLRLKIREELGETYSPASYHVASDTFTGYGYMTAMATLKPEQVDKVKPMFVEIADAIGKTGITEDEFQRAREPQLQQLVQTRRDNRYWITRVLVNCQSQPYRLDWSRSLLEDFSGIKREELEVLSKQYLDASKTLTLGLLPRDAAKSSQ